MEPIDTFGLRIDGQPATVYSVSLWYKNPTGNDLPLNLLQVIVAEGIHPFTTKQVEAKALELVHDEWNAPIPYESLEYIGCIVSTVHNPTSNRLSSPS